MTRINSPHELHIRQKRLAQLAEDARRTITLCGGTGCIALGLEQVYAAFEREI